MSFVIFVSFVTIIRDIISHFKKSLSTPLLLGVSLALNSSILSLSILFARIQKMRHIIWSLSHFGFLIFYLFSSFVSLIRSIFKLSASVLQVHRIIAIVVSLAPIFCHTYVSCSPSLFIFFILSFSFHLSFNRVYRDRRICVSPTPVEQQRLPLCARPACT